MNNYCIHNIPERITCQPSPHWILIQFDRPITQPVGRLLLNNGFMYEGDLAKRHCTNLADARYYQQEAIRDVKGGVTGRSVIITDKQFRDGTVTYKATVRTGTPEVLGGFQSVYQDWVTFFPVSIEQLNESITF